MFAVKLVAQLEKQGYVIKSISLADFKIEKNYIFFHGIKKAVKGEPDSYHLTSL